MDAPTEWTYDGQLDWSSADSLRLAPSGLVFRVIIEAVKERYAAIGISAPALFTTDFNPLAPAKTYIDAIQAAVTDLLSRYVNHADHSGDWTGQTQIPAWTEAAMLTAIEAEERFILYPLSVLSAEWCFQQYQILNLLRWQYVEYPEVDASNSVTEEHGASGDRAGAIALYNEHTWQSTGTGVPSAYSYRTYSGSYGIYRVRWKYTFGTYNTVPKDVDLYFWITKASSPSYATGGTSEFEANGEALSENTFYKHESFEGVTRWIAMQNWFTAIDTIPIITDELNTSLGWQSRPRLICKFDVPGGFKFID